MGLPWLVVAWHAAFAAEATPGVHWNAVYVDARGGHVTEAWRAGERRLRRLTDGRLELYAENDGDDVRYQLTDRGRELAFSGTRAGLARRGALHDWQGWAHVVEPLAPGATVVVG